MRTKMKRIISIAIALVLIAVCIPNVTKGTETKLNEAIPEYRELTSKELTNEMGVGWNLGNTMDGHTGFTPNEILWQPVKTTKNLIKAVHDAGFNTIRIPVTWGTMIDDDNNYAIDEAWISRVQDIVDYAVSQDMYVIINIQHDGAEQTGWLRIATDDKEALYEKFEGVWSNIADRFSDYDEHLIFEAMNEVKGEDMTTLEENEVIMELNQIFVDTVRKSAGNNPKRWLVVCGKYNYIDSIVNESNGFKLPDDSENKIILSVHCYTPWGFCGSDSGSDTEYTIDRIKSTNVDELTTLKKYTDQGIPVIVGEYGCMNRDNSEYRALYLEAMNQLFREIGLVGVYWDQGWYDRSETPDYSFSLFDRETCQSIDKNVTDAIMRGFYHDKSLDEIALNTEVNAIVEIATEESAELSVGDTYYIDTKVLPENTNDIVLYSSDDASIATVYNGMIRGKSVGETTINVYSQSGSVTNTIKVTVTKADVTAAASVINTAAESYDMSVDEYEYLNVTTDGTGNVSYRSGDESVATVSSVGKILAVGEGSTTITIITSDGFSKEIPVTVKDAEKISEIELALNVYYNDSDNSYFSNEVGKETIVVKQGGQYTLRFDCATDLSDAAIKAGVNSLTNLTAIYIKDQAVTTGAATVSPLETADIMYDKITVNGTELTINQAEKKSALKTSGIFDSNDPINSWDGSSVNEIKCSNNVANFDGIDNPTVIEVTFTLTNVKFTGQEVTPDVLEPETAGVESESAKESTSDDETKEETNPFKPVYFVFIGIGAVVIAGIITAAVISKKKKNK